MKYIELNRGCYTKVDDEDYESLIKNNWFVDVGGYAYRGTTLKEKRSIHIMHRVIINAPVGIQVDHINGNRLDNRKSNLRLCNSFENHRNQVKRKDSKLKYKGINKVGNRFRAKIFLDGKQVTSVMFSTQEEAGLEYNRLATIHYKEFAKLNIIE